MSSRSKAPLATVPIIELRKVIKTYAGAQSFTALRGLDLRVDAGELIAVVGKSGSGKSTLLNLIAGIDRPTAGEVLVASARVHELGEDQLARWRGRHVGIVFQFFQLLPTLTVVENVMLPMDLAGHGKPNQRRDRALALLASVGIADQADKLPSALSGGQQQRAAIARALANDPPLIVADEPTGNLDSATASAVLGLLAGLAATGRTVVLISHERDVAAIADRTITLADGAIVDETRRPAMTATAREERAMRSARWAKVRGDLRAARGRVALMIVAVTASLSAVGVVLGVFGIARPELDRNYRETHPASATLEVDSADAALADEVRALPGVTDAEARGAVLTRVRVGADWLPFLLFVVDDFAGLRLNTFRPEAGAWPPPDGTVLLERTATTMLSAPIGSAITLKAPHGPATKVRIAGTVHDPGLAPAWQERTGYGYATRATLTMLGEEPVLGELRIAVTDGANVVATAREVAAWLGARGHVVHEIRIPPSGRHPHAGQMNALMAMMATFAFLGVGLSAILVAATLAALLARQVREIGVLKAIGGSRRQVAALYLTMALVVAVVSLVIAVPVGIAGARGFATVVAHLLNFTLADTHLPAWVLAVQIGAGLIVPVVAAGVPVARGARITVRQALDDEGGLRTSGRPPRIARLVRGRDRRVVLTVRNALRRPARLALVLGLLAAGGAMFLTARGVEAGWHRIVDQVYATRHYDVELRLVRDQPAMQLAARLRTVPGVRVVETWGRAPAAFAVPDQVDVVRTYPDAGHGSFTVFGVPAGSRLVDFPLLAGRWLQDGDDGVVVLNHNARTQSGGSRVGDSVLISFDGRPMRLSVVGVVQEVGAAGGAYVTVDTFARATGTAGVTRFLRIATSAGDPATRTDVIRAVEGELAAAGVAVESAVPLSELRTAMGEHVVVLVRMLQAMALLFALVGVLGLASAMSAAVIERGRELGILRAIGGAPRTVLGLVVGEGVVVGALSWLLAVALAVPLALGVGRIVGALGFGTPLPLSISIASTLAWLGLVMIGGAVASVIPAWQASRRPVHESLVRP